MSNRRNAIYSLLIITLLSGLLSGRTILFNMAYLLGSLLIISLLWSWISVSWLRINRRTRARRAQVGRNFGEAFSVRNTGLLPKLWLEIQDHSNLPGYQASTVVPGMLPRESFNWTSTTMCTSRGEYLLGPLTVTSGDPFGLFRFPRHIGFTSKIVVYPAIVPIQTFAMPSGILSGGDAQRRRAHFVTTNAAGIREYAPGDSFNRIHWKSTARKSRLLVKEFELDPLADVWLFLDLSASSLIEDPGIHQQFNHNLGNATNQDLVSSEFQLQASTEEYGVVIAASLARYFLDKRRSLGFLTYGPQREILFPDRSHRQLNQILELLAIVKGTSDFDLEHMLTLNTEYLGRGTTLVIVTADQSESWVKQAEILSRRGIHVIAVLLDPASFGGNTSTRATEARLATFHAPTYVIQAGDNLSAVLSQTVF